MLILNGNEAAKAIKLKVQNEVANTKLKLQKVPHLAAILVGNDGASMTYVASKESDCKEVGFDSTVIKLSPDISQEALIQEIEKVNSNPDIDGLIVQLPLPKHLDESIVTQTIDPEKDVDGFHDINTGKMTRGEDTYLPATPYGIMLLLEHYGIQTEGKHCVVIGRSNIVGRPASILMSLSKNPGNCTVTICHSKTKDLSYYTLQADIIIAALGIPDFLKAEMVKEGAVVIDVGITRVDDSSKSKGFRLVGDVDYANVKEKCNAITPVPGGVGPMTRVGLLVNTLKAFNKKIE